MSSSRAPPGPADVGMACGLAVLAGATDAYGYVALDGLFVSFMSGNTTLMGIALAKGEAGRIAAIAFLVGAFVAGAAFGTVLDQAGGRRGPALVVGVTALLLLLPPGMPGAGPLVLAVAMGTLNAAMTRLGAATISITYVTGTLVRFGQGLGHALCGKPAGWLFLWQVPMWLSLLAGAALGAVAERATGPGAPWPLPVLAGLLAVAAVLRRPVG